MAQFDVYKNPSKKSSAYYPYLVDIQNDYISELQTRIVIPLAKAEFFNNDAMSRLQISLRFENENLLLMTPQISSISRKQLKKPVGSVAHLRQQIIDALDFAISGI
jgi:toxin CcdB|tara:strand:- start:504 stop:821 length:318 start_codon:yes stop_codon:yes gene_type:complete